MKITGTKTYKFSVPTGQSQSDPHTGELISSLAKSWLFFKIETDAGISGWGEGSGEWLVPAVEATLVDDEGLTTMASSPAIFNRSMHIVLESVTSALRVCQLMPNWVLDESEDSVCVRGMGVGEEKEKL